MAFASGKNLETCADPGPCAQPATTWITLGQQQVILGFCEKHERGHDGEPQQG